MPLYAHSPPQADAPWHLLQDHLNATADLAAGFAQAFGAQKAAALAGLLHDLGKYSEAFQARLRGAPEHVDHSTAGAVEVLALADKAGIADRVTAWLVAYAIAGHHAGLPDYHSADAGSLSERLNKQLPALAAGWRQEIMPDATGLLPKMNPASDLQGRIFALAFLGRMIFSALVDGDFKDTEGYYASFDNCQPDRNWPSLQSLLPDLRQRFTTYMAGMAKPTELGPLRQRILQHVRSQADRAPRFFTLTVPTGGGKTLASLGFALDHAASHNMRRIIYAIPFTSVIEQTAKVFRAALGDDAPLLEHHAALEEAPGSAKEARDKLRLAMEDWAAPVIVTTNVQFFESLFANRPARCRKLHNIAGSVIILDEAQTIPRHLLRPAAMALKELVRNYGCSIVFCTATQPALDQAHFGTDPVGLPLAGGELAPEPEKLAAQMRRTHIVHIGQQQNDDLVAALANRPQGLIIVNTRRHALELYQAAKQELGEAGLFHLSTRQHAAHRQEILGEIRQRLKDRQPCRVIATALVEAGVDVDFPAVWRAEAGLDQVVQAAGRCNREGRQLWQESPVSVFNAPDYPPPREVKALAGDLEHIRRQFADVQDPTALQAYFLQVYWRMGDHLDAEKILALHTMQQYRPEICYRSIAEKFRMIDDSQQPVIIPDHPEWQKLSQQIESGHVSATMLARQLQRHIVQLPQRHHARLLAQGDIRMLAPRQQPGQQSGQQNGFPVLQSRHLYDRECGLQWEKAGELPAALSVV